MRFTQTKQEKMRKRGEIIPIITTTMRTDSPRISSEDSPASVKFGALDD